MRLAIAVLLLLPVGGAAQDDLVKKVVSDADKIKKLPRKLSPEARAKIEKALGEKLLPEDLAPQIWECMSTVPAVSSMAKTKCLVTVVTVQGAKGPIRIGVAAATVETTLHTGKILENGDDRALESKLFLSQFEGFEYTANLWNSPDALAGAIRKGAGGDDAAKEVDTLLKVNTHMRAVGPAWERMLMAIEKREKSAADDIALLDRAFDESMKAVMNSKFMVGTKQDKFKAAAAGARTDLADLKTLIGGSKFDEAFKKTGEIDSLRCARCHAAYRRTFRDGRLTQNLGNGYFSTKLEVAMPEAKLEASYQSVATGIRKAIMIATEAK
jgi:hypothetical protein